MSIHEIEQAIERLRPDEVERLRTWLDDFSKQSANGGGHSNGRSNKPATLAEAMGGLLGAVGKDHAGVQTSSRDAGHAFADHLVTKKSEHRL
jgi:hypothetical protein